MSLPLSIVLTTILLVGIAAPGDTSPLPADLLAGPSVQDDAAAPSIVDMAFDGVMTRLDEPADVAAIRRLTLTEPQRAAFDALLAERTSMFDQLVRDNYELVAGLASGTPDRRSRAARERYLRLNKAFKPYLARATMYDEFRTRLTDEQRAEVDRMLREYETARLVSLSKELGDNVSERQLRNRVRIELLGREIRASIERRANFAQAQFEEMAAALDLTDVQRSQAQAIFQPVAIADFGGKVTADMRGAAGREFLAILTPPQRRTLMQMRIDRGVASPSRSR